jgi:hypothetical protein
MKTVTTTITKIEVDCKSLSFFYWRDIGTLTIYEKDEDSSIEIKIHKDELVNLDQ